MLQHIICCMYNYLLHCSLYKPYGFIKFPIKIGHFSLKTFQIFDLDRYFIDGKLSIFGVQAADEGHFTCQAVNKLLKKSIHLPIAIGKYHRIHLYIESLLSLLTFPSWTIFN